jgi:hypothetical protein
VSESLERPRHTPHPVASNVALKYRLKKDEHGSLTDELKKLYV